MNQKQRLYTIQEISRKLNIPKSTLRYWEKEFEGLFTPKRTKGGQRRYSRQDFALTERIKEMKTKGLKLFEIRQQLAIYLDHNIERSAIGNIEVLAERLAESVRRELYSIFYDTGKLR